MHHRILRWLTWIVRDAEVAKHIGMLPDMPATVGTLAKTGILAIRCHVDGSRASDAARPGPPPWDVCRQSAPAMSGAHVILTVATHGAQATGGRSCCTRSVSTTTTGAHGSSSTPVSLSQHEQPRSGDDRTRQHPG